MKGRGRVGLAVFLLVAAVAAQVALVRWRRQSSPVLAESAYALIGGLRSIAAEVIWFRADRLQDEGRYAELAQLANMLTLMEPHTPEVWSYAAWNLAYNVSVMMPTPEDRWRWVLAGLRLLRDDGLALNPQSAELYRELAWLFELKIGAGIDSAAETYRREWRKIVNDVAARGAWGELRMDPMRMKAVEESSGFNDWTDPALSAVYWAGAGIDQATDDKQKAILANILRQSCVIYAKRHGILVK